jgi:Flp pilus assembly protein TadG
MDKLTKVAGPRSGLRRVTALRPSRSEVGQAAVEFALVLPVLLLILLGIVKGGILFNNYLQLTDASRAGGRDLAVRRGDPTACTDAANQFLNSLGSLDRNRIKIVITENPQAPSDPVPNAVYTWQNGSGSSTGSTPNNPSDCGFTLQSGSAVTLTASYPCDFSILGVGLSSGCALTASTSERVE